MHEMEKILMCLRLGSNSYHLGDKPEPLPAAPNILLSWVPLNSIWQLCLYVYIYLQHFGRGLRVRATPLFLNRSAPGDY